MFALSVKQPYASQIARGAKRVEYRSWKVSHRGPLLIVASKAPKIGDLPTGVAVCVVDLVNVTGHDGAYEWHLRNPRAVDAIAVRGSAALYKVPDDRITYVAGAPRATAAKAAREAPREPREDVFAMLGPDGREVTDGSGFEACEPE